MSAHVKKILIIVGIIILLAIPVVIHAIQAKGEPCEPATWLRIWLAIPLSCLIIYVFYSDFLKGMHAYGGTRIVAMVFLWFYFKGWANGEYLVFPDERLVVYFNCSTLALAWYECMRADDKEKRRENE